MATTIGGVDVGKVQTFRTEKSANIITLPFPGLDSDSAETFDLLGVTRIINIDSVIVGTTATVLTTVDALEAIIDGDQTTSVTLSTDFMTDPINVKILTISVVWSIDGVGNKAEISIQLTEGKD